VAPRLSVVVPAFEESAAIASTVAALRSGLNPAARAGGLELIIVDDGSSDATAARAAAAGADRVLRLNPHRGKGAAVRAGVQAASGSVVAFCDADLAYPPEQLLRLLARIDAGWDVAVGSRRHVDTVTLVRARRTREVTGRVFSALTAAAVLGRAHDTQCGVKAFRSGAAQAIFSRARVDGFAFDVEIFVIAAALALSVAEVPVELSNSGASSVSVGRDTVRMLRDLVRIRWWERHGRYAQEAPPGPQAPRL